MVVKFFDSRKVKKKKRCFINSICLSFYRLKILEFSCIRVCYHPFAFVF